MQKRFLVLSSVAVAALLFSLHHKRFVFAAKDSPDKQNLLPTGKRITPLATPGAQFETLNPDLADFPDFRAGQAISTAVSPDANTLLILTSGFNRVKDRNDKQIDDASQEYVFVYDIGNHRPRKTQVLKIPNTFAGITFAPNGAHFWVSGGKDDNVYEFSKKDTGQWQADSSAVKLNHTRGGLGLDVGKEPASSAGIAVTPDGKTLLVANLYNDSISLIDTDAHAVRAELDLRPGGGIPGGEYPFWVVAKSDSVAYVSSLRDREVLAVNIGAKPSVSARIRVNGNPNKMVLNRAGLRLYVAQDNSDSVAVIDTVSNTVREYIATTAPAWLLKNPRGYTGSAPNALCLSPDEKTLYVTNGGSNSVAVIELDKQASVSGLIPTGWAPNSVSVSADGRWLYVVNGKSVPGPNPGLHLKSKNEETKPGMGVALGGKNEYIYQLEKAGFLSAPLPDKSTLENLTRIAGANNDYAMRPDERDARTMAELRKRIKHVIYIVKENRTYDQVLGDLPAGNGDASLTEFGRNITPNLHAIARGFVNLDNFYNSGEVSGDGWPWSTSGRESDFGIKAVPLNYSGRGTQYEYEGPNRDINVGLATLKDRKAANPKTPDDPDLLPGTANVAEPDGPKGTAQGKGYIWDAVLRKGLTFREYGAMSDMAADAPREPYPFKAKIKMQRPANPELYKFGDPYFRGFDPGYPDFFREAEWEREFAGFVADGKLPSFEVVQLCLDHMGSFDTAIAGVNTPETQQADNDYAVGRLIDRVAHSRYASDTLIFVIEDDSQDGPDHVDAHRTTAYVAGPYVKHNAVVSAYYTTVSMIRTMEDVLGLDHLNLNTATTRPMTDVFDLRQTTWTFDAAPSAVLAKTRLPLDEPARKAALSAPQVKLAHSAHYWAAKTKGFDFRDADRLDAGAFNRVIWEGLKGTPYPH